MSHDRRLLREELIEEKKKEIPEWVEKLKRPPTPLLISKFGPLQGLRVVSTGIHIAQPWVGTQMAMFGAEVIHVERLGGDLYRLMAPLLKGAGRIEGCGFAEIGKCRISCGVDLKAPEGREIIQALWKISDVWMESSIPGTYARLGFPDELALAVNPKLVILHVSSYGQYGAEEYLGRAGYDMMGQAMGGMMYVTGEPNRPPQVARIYKGDYITAYSGLSAVLMALRHVEKTGEGQVIDLAQFEAVAQTQEATLTAYTGLGVIMERAGSRSPIFQPYDCFKAKDGWVVIGAFGPIIFDRVVKVLGLNQEKYNYDTCSRDAKAVESEIGKEFDRKLRDWVAQRTMKEVEEIMNENKIGCCRVYSAKDMVEDPHYQAREDFVDVVDQMVGKKIKVFGVVPKFSRTPGRIWRSAPAVGQDTKDILTKLLGFSEEKVNELMAKGVVHQTEPALKESMT